jgi:hypothetical protein
MSGISLCLSRPCAVGCQTPHYDGMVEINVIYGSLQRDGQRAYPVDPGNKGDSLHPGRREPWSRLSQTGSEGQAHDRTPNRGRPVERSAAAGAAARAITPNGRAGRHPFSPGPPELSDDDAPQADLWQTLYVLIVNEWAQTLAGPFDWANWPLDRYVFGERFHEQLEDRKNLENAAWVCAMIACGLAQEFPELDVQPRPLQPDGGQLAHADGAEGCRCRIVSGRGTGSCLDFRYLSSGIIEFESFTTLHLVRRETKADAE